MKVVTHRDENGKRVRLRSYRGEGRYHVPGSIRRYTMHGKYMPHQGKREKSRRQNAAMLIVQALTKKVA